MMAENTHDILRKVVQEAKCFPNWKFSLIDDGGALRLVITMATHNNYDHSQPFRVNHLHPVPMATYNEKSWRRWVFEQCRRSMTHEIGEALRFGTDENPIRPFVPMHGPGEDPYTAHEIRSEEDGLTAQDGSLRERPV
jgi:hypothetical protein